MRVEINKWKSVIKLSSDDIHYLKDHLKIDRAVSETVLISEAHLALPDLYA